MFNSSPLASIDLQEYRSRISTRGFYFTRNMRLSSITPGLQLVYVENSSTFPSRVENNSFPGTQASLHVRYRPIDRHTLFYWRNSTSCRCFD